MYLPSILFPIFLSYQVFGAPVPPNEPAWSLEARKTPLPDPKVIKSYLQNLNGKVDPNVIKPVIQNPKVIVPFLKSVKGKILPKDINDLNLRSNSFWTKVSPRDAPAADNNDGTDAEDESDIPDFYGPVDEDDVDNEDDGDDGDYPPDKRDTSTAEEDDTAPASPVGDDADGEDEDEDGDEDFSALDGTGDDGDELLDNPNMPTAKEDDTSPTSTGVPYSYIHRRN